MNTKQLIFLIVDDSVIMLNAINGLLRSLGYINIVAARNGKEALQILYSQPINVVLSDWEMPIMDGPLLNAVRADPKLCRLPFLIISDGTNRMHAREVIHSGVSDFLLKPYTTRDLTNRIGKVVLWKPREISAMLTPLDQKKSSRPTILAVDDMPDNLFLLTNLFKDEYRVRAANNGETALAICQSDDPPDLVLLDVMMPIMDGFEVAKRMRNHPGSEHIPIIFITAMGNNDARLKGFELGAIDFIAKPINPDVLKPRICNFMHYVAMNRQLQADYDSMQELTQLRNDIKEPLTDVISLVQSLSKDNKLSTIHVHKLRTIEETALQMLNRVNRVYSQFDITAK